MSAGLLVLQVNMLHVLFIFCYAWKMKTHRPYSIEEYDPTWKDKYSFVAKKLEPIFGDNFVEINHIGSTSILGMVAKPQIDILVVVKDLEKVKESYEALKVAGFTPRGRGYVNYDDEYFTEDTSDGRRLTSVHTLQTDNPRIKEYKNFRDYLTVNKEDRELYIATKKALYTQHRDNFAEYDPGKEKIVKQIITRANQWVANR